MASMAGFMWTTWNPSREKLQISQAETLFLLSVVVSPFCSFRRRLPAGAQAIPYARTFLKSKEDVEAVLEGFSGLRRPKTSHRRWIRGYGTTAAGPL